jgi:vitamin B12 transporter
VVTAGLAPVSLHDVATSVTVITREEIERRQVKYLAELLRDVPGFSVSQSGGPGTYTQVRVRGAESNQLLVLMDGIRANDPASNDEFQFQYALTADIERIEIIRGPQSATWGTDALAGVINIIRRKDISGQYLNTTAEYGSFDSLNLGVDGGMNNERYQLSGGVAFLDTDGTNISRTAMKRGKEYHRQCQAERCGHRRTKAGLHWPVCGCQF